MLCNQCGKEIPEEALFCPNCGAKQEQPREEVVETPAEEPVVEEETTKEEEAPVAEEEPKEAQIPVTPPVSAIPEEVKPKKKKGLFALIAVVGILAVAAIVAVCVFVLPGKGKYGYKLAKDSISCTGFYFFNKEGEVLGQDMWDVEFSEDMSVAAFLDPDLSLYCIDVELTPVLIAENIAEMEISRNGEYIAYTSYEDLGDPYNTTLYLYDVERDRSTKMDTEVYAYEWVLSPGGDAIAYLKDYEGYEDNTLYMTSLKGEPEKIDRDGAYPLAIRDGAKGMYFFNTSDKLYYYDGKDVVKIDTDVNLSSYSSFSFTSDISEILYGKSNGTYYYTPKMDEAERVSTEQFYGSVTTEDIWSLAYDDTYITNWKTFKGSLFATDYSYCWLNEEGTDSVKICSSYESIQMSTDGTSLLYTEGGGLYKLNSFSETMKPKVLYEGEEYLSTILASNDLSRIYVGNSDGEIFYCKGKNKLNRISFDYESPCYNEADEKLYYIEDETVYSVSTNAKDKEAIMDNASLCYADLGGILCRVYIGDGSYDTKDFIKFEGDPKELFIWRY